MQLLAPTIAANVRNFIVESSSAAELAALVQEAIADIQASIGAATALSFANLTLSAGGDGRKFVCSGAIAPAGSLSALATSSFLTVAALITGTATGATAPARVRFTQAGNAVDLLAARAAALAELDTAGVTRIVCIETAVASNDGQMAEMILGVEV